MTRSPEICMMGRWPGIGWLDKKLEKLVNRFQRSGNPLYECCTTAIREGVMRHFRILFSKGPCCDLSSSIDVFSFCSRDYYSRIPDRNPLLPDPLFQGRETFQYWLFQP